MRFEPRLFSDAGDNADFPDDLQMVAEQLTADADRLSALYPAKLTSVPKGIDEDVAVQESEPNRRTLRRIVASAAALLIAVGTSSWYSAHRPHQKEHNNGTAVATVGDPTEIKFGNPTEIDRPMSAGFFQELTGPEQEGVLDLLENSGTRPSSLSI